MKFAHRLADGPTVAHGATKRIIRAYPQGRRRGGRQGHRRTSSPSCSSQDLQNAVASFLKDGPGKATFEGR